MIRLHYFDSLVGYAIKTIIRLNRATTYLIRKLPLEIWVKVISG